MTHSASSLRTHRKRFTRGARQGFGPDRAAGVYLERGCDSGCLEAQSPSVPHLRVRVQTPGTHSLPAPTLTQSYFPIFLFPLPQSPIYAMDLFLKAPDSKRVRLRRLYRRSNYPTLL